MPDSESHVGYELLDGGPVGDVDGLVEELPVEVPHSPLELLRVGRDDPVGHASEEIGGELAENLSNGLTSRLDRPQARA